MRPTQSLSKAYRKLKLTVKDVNKGYYKGTRTGRMGNHTKHGDYRIDWNLVRTYVVPEGLSTFKLTPFVTAKMRPIGGDYSNQTDGMGPRSPALYLSKWKAENGFD